MSNYNLKPSAKLPSLAWQEAREKRKKVLEAVRKGRGEPYRQFMYQPKNRSLQTSNDL